jgi:hypothetical protein
MLGSSMCGSLSKLGTAAQVSHIDLQDVCVSAHALCFSAAAG